MLCVELSPASAAALSSGAPWESGPLALQRRTSLVSAGAASYRRGVRQLSISGAQVDTSTVVLRSSGVYIRGLTAPILAVLFVELSPASAAALSYGALWESGPLALQRRIPLSLLVRPLIGEGFASCLFLVLMQIHPPSCCGHLILLLSGSDRPHSCGAIR